LKKGKNNRRKLSEKWIAMMKRVGAYLGTEIDETWWKRYRKDGFFARGSGEYWFEDDVLYFRRYLTKKPIAIPYNGIEEVRVGKWHAGQWRMGKPILKIVWLKNGLRLSSGFVVSRSLEETLNLKEELERRLK
jgi:hypothetical protein